MTGVRYKIKFMRNNKLNSFGHFDERFSTSSHKLFTKQIN